MCVEVRGNPCTSFDYIDMSKKQTQAAKLVSSAITGMDFATVVVNGKVYVIMSPNIHKLSSIGYYFSQLGEGETVRDLLLTIGSIDKLACILSILICGDISLAEELAQGSIDEVVSAVDEGLSLINVEPFMKLSALRKSVLMLTAKPKQ